jgi:hypothetical protein
MTQIYYEGKRSEESGNIHEEQERLERSKRRSLRRRKVAEIAS